MGRIVGSYELLERIGEGGMGEVWRARHRTLGRLAAVKLVRPGAGDPAELEQRFLREARVTAELGSPHTIQVLDVGRADDGALYAAMELLDGLDLRQLVEAHGPQPPGRVAALLAQACDALAEAHQKGVVHRDVKPSNLFCARIGARVDVVKVLDFGLARPPADAVDPHLTRTGMLAGSPAWLAPEVLRGQPPSDRADVYGLGCVAWWLLTGRPVYEGGTAFEVMAAHLERAVPDASSLPGVSPELAGILRTCLAKDPASRPGARELGRALAALPSTWSAEDAEAWWALRPAANRDVDRAPLHTPTPLPAPAPQRPVALEPLREQAYQALRAGFEASRLDLGEYERRLTRARTAADAATLQGTIADLANPEGGELAPAEFAESGGATQKKQPVPALPAAPANAPIPSTALATRTTPGQVVVLSSLTRHGRWSPAARSRFVTVLGSAELDLREADLLPGMTEIRAVAVFGSVEITVPPGIYVDAQGVGVVGSFDQAASVAAPPTGDTPWIRVTGVAVFGSVEIKVRPVPGPNPVAEAAVRVVRAIADRFGKPRGRLEERAEDGEER